MKFSEIEQAKWDELAPYLDTCLLPFTGLNGTEKPWEVTEALERLQDVMDEVEKPFTGRIITYPAVHYQSEMEEAATIVERTAENVRAAGFKYVVVISVQELHFKTGSRSVDLFLDSSSSSKELQDKIVTLWTT